MKILNKKSCYLSKECVIDKKCTIGPNTCLYGKCCIKSGTIISNSTLYSCEVGENCAIENSHLDCCYVGNQTSIGPYARLRSKSVVGENCRIGNFVEIKNSQIGNGTKIAHLAYVGDSYIGNECNIGCGAIFANYDGESKHCITVGDYSFIGSNCNLIAPLNVGKGCFIGAGTTVSKDLLPFSFCVGRASVKTTEDIKLKYYLSCLKKHNPSKKYFGTDGIRNTFPDKINDDIMKKCAFALSKIKQPCKIAIGGDSRESTPELKKSLINWLAYFSPNSTIDDYGLISSPGLSYVTSAGEYDFGAMITASHNPSNYNGIKFFNNKGEKISQKDECLFENLFEELTDKKTSFVKSVSATLKDAEEYVDYIKKQIKFDKNVANLYVDLSNGATCEIAKQVLDSANLSACYINDNLKEQINRNSFCLNHGLFSEFIKTKNNAIGVSFDGDGDRIIMCDELGKIIDGDKIAYLISKYYLALGLNANVVCTNQSNMGLQTALEKMSVDCVVTDVGDRNVYSEMKNNSSLIGCEKSGHVILKKYLNTGDGLLTLVEVLNALNFFKTKLCDFEFFEECFHIEKTYKICDIKELNFIFEQVEKIKQKNSDIKIIVRKSGTEEVLRVLVEGESKKKCQEIFNKICKAIIK